MQTVISVINFIHARDLNHRKFKELLEELRAHYSDVLLHTAVKWLSKGKVLEWFGKNCPELDVDEWWIPTAFLTDITQKFNTLNLELQGPNKVIGQMTNKIFTFEAKLKLYINELKVKDLSNLPTVAMLRSGLTIAETIYQNMKEYLFFYLEEIKNRFADVRNIRRCFILIGNPWRVGQDDLKLFCQFGFPKTNLLNEIIELQHYTQLTALFIEHHETQQYTEFWKCVPNNYKNL
ncbi:general transcription factor II-I repeat domain-containing protein 2-like [Schistocerca serialis cubense]|uniref:general transcription factor II-I repeat domain-containing protein 2-like n=1 Tax=Schistocerca serialis cubense TaxID=2023355 RepID=UPI00214F5AAD|nr:general transcription factor II-I repeat domain-containing protein 2-like [Schistocerca serialis cubense]